MNHRTLRISLVATVALALCMLAQLSLAQPAAAQEAAPSSYQAGSSSKSALDKTFGIGLALGTVIGPDLQIRLTRNDAIDIVIGGKFVGYWGRQFYMHAQYEHRFDLASWDNVGTLGLYVGAGLFIGYARYRYGFGGWYGGVFDRYDTYNGKKGAFLFGLRVPVGVSMSFAKAPFDVFMEFAPGVQFLHQARFAWTYTLGGRYWF